MTIKNITMEHLARYGEIYAEAFPGSPGTIRGNRLEFI